MLSTEVLLPPQHGVIECLKVLGGIRMAEEPVESRPDEQRAEERSLRVVGFREEQLLRPGESFGIELLQGWVGGDQRILQSPGPKAEFLSVFALQHRGDTHRLWHCLQEGIQPSACGLTRDLETFSHFALKAVCPKIPAVRFDWELINAVHSAGQEPYAFT